MDLKEFVSKSLAEITQGVMDAQKGIADSGGRICPVMKHVFTESQSGGTNLALGYTKTGTVVFVVDFDVAVTVSEGQGKKAGIGVLSGIISLGAQGRSDQENVAVSRIRFKVPIALPTHA